MIVSKNIPQTVSSYLSSCFNSIHSTLDQLNAKKHSKSGLHRNYSSVVHQRLGVPLISLCSLSLTLTPPPNNALLADLDMWRE